MIYIDTLLWFLWLFFRILYSSCLIQDMKFGYGKGLMGLERNNANY